MTMLDILYIVAAIGTIIWIALDPLTQPGFQKLLFRIFIQLYPPSYRQEHGVELIQIYLSACQQAVEEYGKLGVVWRVIGDIAGMSIDAIPLRYNQVKKAYSSAKGKSEFNNTLSPSQQKTAISLIIIGTSFLGIVASIVAITESVTLASPVMRASFLILGITMAILTILILLWMIVSIRNRKTIFLDSNELPQPDNDKRNPGYGNRK